MEHVERLGAYSLLHGKLGEEAVIVKLQGWTDVEIGQTIDVDYDAKLVCFFDAETENRIR